MILGRCSLHHLTLCQVLTHRATMLIGNFCLTYLKIIKGESLGMEQQERQRSYLGHRRGPTSMCYKGKGRGYRYAYLGEGGGGSLCRIAPTLTMMRDYVDYWAVLVTNTSDNTSAVVNSIMKPVPGQVVEDRLFTDFASARNRILQVCAPCCVDCPVSEARAAHVMPSNNNTQRVVCPASFRACLACILHTVPVNAVK